MNTSKLFSLDWRDLLKGLIMAVAGSVVSVVSNSINTGNFTITFASVWHGALVAGVAYLGKNFFTPPAAASPNNPIAK